MKQGMIERHILLNIKKYGKADTKAILSKMIGEDPSLKKKIPQVMEEIEKHLKGISKLPKSELKQRLSTLKEEKRKKVPGKTLPELKKVPFPYVFRFEPSPTGPLHIGHMIVLLLNAEYAKKYSGKMVVRIADTNPEDIYEPAYTLIVEDATWVTQQPIQTVIQSDKMEDYYLHAKLLIDHNHAYVCTCNQESFRNLALKKQACPCRSLSPEEHKERWEKMFTEYEMGEAVLRIKTDISHKNPAVRDWAACRINDAPHPRHGKEYRVWPLMNFSVAVDDHDASITHVIRGKDHIVNMERQIYIYRYFKWNIPEFIHIGRINFRGMKISTSGFREGIEKKQYTGWDDPRLPTLCAFKRRGIHPEAFIHYIHELGPSRVDKTVDYNMFIKAIYSYNRAVIDKRAKRYFFVESPKKVEVKNAPRVKVQIPLHPEVSHPEHRALSTAGTFYIEDALQKNKVYRFMHLFNIKNGEFHSMEPQPRGQAKLIHWLPVSDDLINVKIVMPDNTARHGLAEPSIRSIAQGEVIQFERKFFCRLDAKSNEEYVFYYTHP